MPPTSAVTQDIVRFRQAAAKVLGTKIEQIILFGSRARGDANRDSDTDLIVVSTGFVGLPFHRRSARIRRAWPSAGAVDLLCYTPDEFAAQRAKPGIIQEAVMEGIEA